MTSAVRSPRRPAGWRRALARLHPPLWVLVLACATTALGGIAWTHQTWAAHFERAHALEDALGETLRHVEQAQGLAREQITSRDLRDVREIGAAARPTVRPTVPAAPAPSSSSSSFSTAASDVDPIADPALGGVADPTGASDGAISPVRVLQAAELQTALSLLDNWQRLAEASSPDAETARRVTAAARRFRDVIRQLHQQLTQGPADWVLGPQSLANRRETATMAMELERVEHLLLEHMSQAQRQQASLALLLNALSTGALVWRLSRRRSAYRDARLSGDWAGTDPRVGLSTGLLADERSDLDDGSDVDRADGDPAITDLTIRAARAMPDPYWVVDGEGQRMAGPLRDLPLDLAEPPLRERMVATVRSALSSGRVQSLPYRLDTDQGPRWYEARVQAMPGTTLVVWQSRDVSAGQAAGQREQDRSRLHRFKSHVDQAIVWARSAHELFDRVTRVAISEAGLQLAWLVESGGQGRAPRLRSQHGEPALMELCAASLPPATHSHAAALAQAQLSGLTQWRPGCVRSSSGEPLDLLALPVRNAEAVVAVLMLVGPRLDPDDPDQHEVVRELGMDLSHALARLSRDARMQESLARVRLHAAALESTQDGVMVTDLRPRIVSVNRAYSEITGYTEADVAGQSPKLLTSGRHDPTFFTALWESLLTHGRWQGEIQNRRKNGELYTQWTSISTVRNDAGEPTHYVTVFTDITAQKQAEAQLQHLAHFDPLTQLPNRLLVLNRLDHAIAAADRAQRRVAVLFIDLDNFKTVNDSLGHAAGDRLLEAVAQRLLTRARREDTLGRLGGDEFILILEQVRESPEAAQVAQELLTLLEAPFHIAGQDVYVQSSIGISIYPEDAREAGELVRDADAAMYQAKRAGRGTYRYYTEALTAAAQNKLTLDTRLRRALEQREFELYYQPLYRIADRRLIGLEALVRLNQPGLPPVGPADFIPVLEENGQITALGAWVTQEACRQGRAWLDEGLDFGRIAINLSPQEVRRGQTDERVRAALQASGLPADRLELEITESGLMEQGERAEAFLHNLRSIGVQLAIDDFGTGYSSLAYLKRFPVSKLKIDRGFVRDLPGDVSDAQLVQTMISMGRNLGISVVAEGVETEAQLDYLHELGCESAQGYLFSKPRPASEARAWLPRLAEAPSLKADSEGEPARAE
ncbi:putative bifunctional diguanylate cyclase/phosphodiesterase [Sphaerotilus mobilis]|uniref:PAS domain S-box-containing protein/diguanylate cyclase (GGDEF)-like protein n=1 Tax=Sphaerotilus mobilis TaxID=47994 RepID=A0A4Q7LQD9_9BURK|nr:EAL domain-containing protein [Sphaerotilus mobilis]RZS57065.1 PAS domain S-box-containing protein/diguanylate cyclase (GGDEF)-like protein [Sphaerotilus mobilis]